MSQSYSSRMQEVTVKIAFIGLGLALSTLANAQQQRGARYTGPRANINSYQKSPESDFRFCDEDPQSKLTRETYAACVKAIAGAKSMAEMCAQANGELDGYRRGYSWAFYNSLNQAQKDPAAYGSGKQSIYNDQNTNPYIRQKAEEANRSTFGEASSRGSSLAIQRFTDFVDSGASRAGGVPSSVLPNPIPVPAHGSPYQNPYSSLMPGQFQSIEELIDQAQYDAANQLSFMNRYDSVYGVTRPQLNMRSLYVNDGVYNPSPSMCGNPEQVFARWTSNDRLGKGVYVAYGTPVTRAGDVQRGSDGGVVRGGGSNPPPIVRGDQSAAQPAQPAQPNLQEIYSRAFRQAYGTFSSYYYSVGFYKNLDLGQYYGETNGRQIGGQYAFQTGRRDAFNEIFYQTEASVFSNYAVTGFDSGFKNQYQEYLTHPQPAFEFVDVVGEIDDGIIQPNEKFSVVVRVKNYGGVGNEYPAQLAGSVTEAKGFTLKAPKFSSQVFTSPIAGRVAAASGNNARVVLQVAGRELPISQYVTDQVTPTEISYSADVPNGIVKVIVTVVNHSKVKSYDVVKVNLNDTNNHVLSQNLGFLTAGQSLPVTFTISGYDPLAIIDGKISVQAQGFLGSLNIGTQGAQIRSTNVNYDLAKYFDLLVQDGTKDAPAQLVYDRLVNLLDAETSEIADNKYSESATDYSTVLYSVRGTYKAHPQTASSNQWYNKLAKDFSRHNHIGFLRFAQKNRFKAALNEIGD